VELLVQQAGLSLRGLEHVVRSSALGARGHADARAGAALLGPGFAHVVDPDMLHLGDDVTVQALFQAHTFEDRVLKVDHVHVRDGATVGANAVLLYGADVGAGATVAPHSVVMKRERLEPGAAYEGVPTRACFRGEGATVGRTPRSLP
jgi:acetyltransferase-like isoleucine patch superfamily enzyme